MIVFYDFLFFHFSLRYYILTCYKCNIYFKNLYQSGLVSLLRTQKKTSTLPCRPQNPRALLRALRSGGENRAARRFYAPVSSLIYGQLFAISRCGRIVHVYLPLEHRMCGNGCFNMILDQGNFSQHAIGIGMVNEL